MDRPTGVTTIAILFFAAAAYLCALGAVMLAWPGAVSMSAGAPLLSGLELSGPYMFLLTSAVAALIGWGLRRMHKWARWVTILVCFAGFVMLIPSVSAAVLSASWSLVWGGLGIIVRMVVVWYLWMEPVAEQFGSVATRQKND